MKTILDLLKLSADFLTKKGIERARRSAEEVIASVLQMRRLDLYLRFDQPVMEKELVKIREKIKRLGQLEPLGYVLGEVPFLECTIQIDSRALIPRPETEILADLIAKQNPKGVLWDVCTGSGCIGIALKKAFPDLQVTLSDLSLEALELARENAKKNQVEVRFLHGDLLSCFRDEKADWIVSNPPYISEEEYLQLDPSVKDFEPPCALIGGKSGWEYYERFAKQLPAHVQAGGQVFFEIGAGQKEALLRLFPHAHIYEDWACFPRFCHVKF